MPPVSFQLGVLSRHIPIRMNSSGRHRGIRIPPLQAGCQEGQRRAVAKPPALTTLRVQMRAAKPDSQGETVRDGVRLHWELYGSGDPTVFLLPCGTH